MSRGKTGARKRRSKREAKPEGAAELTPEPEVEQPSDASEREKPWKDRRVVIEAIAEQLRGPLSAQQIRGLAEQLLQASEDPKWEVRLAVARAIAFLEHPDYVTVDVDEEGTILYRFPQIHWRAGMAPNGVPPHVRVGVEQSSVRVDAREPLEDEAELVGAEPARRNAR